MQAARHWRRRRFFKRRVRQRSRSGHCGPAIGALRPARHRVYRCATREGYDGPAPPNRIINEAANASATAALYPNIEHVVVPNEGASPLANLDRKFFLLDRPVRGLCSTGWAQQL